MLNYVLVNSNWIPRATPGKIVFERANPGHLGNFLSNSLPRAKKLWSNSRGWGKIFPNLKKLLLKLAKLLKNKENYERVQIYLENLTKPLYFRRKQNHSKVFKVVVRAEILARNFLQTLGDYYLSLTTAKFQKIKTFHLSACKKSLQIKNTTREYKFIWRT